MSIKNKIIVVIGILAIIGVIAATGYAMYTASFSGTSDNKLRGGSVFMSCSEGVFSLTNTTSMTDEQGLALDNNEWTCTLNTTINGSMNIGYDVALYDLTPSATLAAGNIKMRALKEKNNNITYLVGNATSGELMSSISNQKGVYDKSITSYKLDSTTTNTTEEVVYKIKAWVASENTNITATNIDGKCSNTTYTTKEECESAGEIWGYNQNREQAGGTFSFKVKVGATQIIS
jgi:hypothetical protein